jgi:Neurotransmitter-gated ion-channel ligand binding domain
VTAAARLATGLVVALVLGRATANAAVPAGTPADAAPPAALTATALLAPPPQDGPVVVRARFDLQDINAIDDQRQTFEFAGVLALVWRDPRQAFDVAVAGVEEKVFQGAYQVNEVATGWYPQAVLVNQAGGMMQVNGVTLRIRPDGTSTLLATLNAEALGDFDMHRFPFDAQRLEAIFEILGFDADEIRLQVDPVANPIPDRSDLPQWTITGVSTTVRDRPAVSAGSRGVASAMVLTVDVQRQSWFARRLIVAPLAVIVVLSFSVFWMDRSSLGDRLSVSFIGILTAVAYQLVTSDHLPRISYITLIHAFLNISFFTMCATVVVNLVVGTLDKQGRTELGDRIDRCCRWIFPLVYFGLVFLMLGIERVVF